MRRLYLTWLRRVLWYPIRVVDKVAWWSDCSGEWLREVRWTVEKKLLGELDLDDFPAPWDQ